MGAVKGFTLMRYITIWVYGRFEYSVGQNIGKTFLSLAMIEYDVVHDDN
jgi:hypothetical protein